MRKTFCLAVALIGALLQAAPAHAEPAPDPAPPAAHGSRLRVVGLMLASSQVLLWDGELGRYVLRQIGETYDGATLVAIAGTGSDSHLVVERDGRRERVDLSAPPQERVAVRRPPATIAVARPPAAAVPVEATTADSADPAPAIPGVASEAVLAPSALAAPSPGPTPPAPPAPTSAQAGPPPDAAAAPQSPPEEPSHAPAPPAAPAYPYPAGASVAPLAAAAPAGPQSPAPPPAASAELAGAPGPAAAPPPPGPPVRPAAPPPPPAFRAPPAALPESEAPTVWMPRAEFDRHFGNLDELDEEAAIVASRHGYQLAEVRRGGFLERLGLRSGDVVLAVDGRAIRSPDDAARAYAWLRVTDHFSVDLLRSGARVRLRYQLGS